MHRSFPVLAVIGLVAAACSPTVDPAPSVALATTVPPASAATPGPTAAVSTPATTARASVRPSLPPGSPTIADPYWLIDAGTDTSTWQDRDGTVLRTKTGRTYRVIKGGGVEDGVLVDGTDVALLSVHTLTGEDPIPGLNAIEEQYGAQIDDATPDPSLPFISPTPDNPDIWTRTTETRGTVEVHVRTETATGTGGAAAYWWTDPPEAFRSLMLQPDSGETIDALLTAVLGPAR